MNPNFLGAVHDRLVREHLLRASLDRTAARRHGRIRYALPALWGVVLTLLCIGALLHAHR